MNFLKKIFGGLNQKGVIHLIPLFLLLTGIIVGVYLVQKEGFQLFKPKASSQNVQFLPNECLTTKDSKQVLTCNKVKLHIISPLETGQTTDAGFQLVKTASADSSDGYNLVGDKCSDDADNADKLYDNQDQEVSTCRSGQTCQKIDFKGLIFGFGKDTKAFCSISGSPIIEDSSWKCESNGREIYQEGAVLGFFNVKKVPCPDGTLCKDNNGRISCEPQAQSDTAAPSEEDKPPVPQSETRSGSDWYCDGNGNLHKDGLLHFFDITDTVVECKNNTKCEQNLSTKEVKCKEPPAENAPPKKDPPASKCQPGKDLGIEFPNNINENWTSVKVYNDPDSPFSEGQRLSAKFKVFHCNNASRAVCADNLTSKPDYDEVLIDENITIPAPPKGETSISFADLRQKILNKVPAALRCGRIQVDLGIDACPGDVVGGSVINFGRNCGDAVSLPQAPAAPAVPAAGTPQTPTTPQAPAAPAVPAAGVAPTTPQAAPASQTVRTCKNETKTWEQIDAELRGAQYDGAFDHSSTELAAYNRTACPSAANVSKVTTAYRIAESPAELLSKPWITYTNGVGGMEVPYEFSNSIPGRHDLFVQFKDNQEPNQIIKVGLLDYAQISIELVEPSAPATQPPPPLPPGAPPSSDGGGTTGCPLETWRNYDIPTLKQKCSSTELAKLPTAALKDFSNQDLLAIAQAVDGSSGPYKFLVQFDNDRLDSFDLSVLKKLPQSRIDQLPDSLRNAISGKSTTAESAECILIDTAVSSSDRKRGNVRMEFEGKPQSLQIWVAANSEVGKSSNQVTSWSYVTTTQNPVSGSTYNFDLAGFSSGLHAVLMSLHGSYGQMLDGNPGDRVNSLCTSSINVD